MSATNLHFRVQVISRGAGKSAPAAASYRSGTVVHVGGRSVVASASYRSGETLHDERLDRTFDYTRKEDVLYAEILAPSAAPGWVYDRSKLWNGVEAAEKRKDAQLARDIIAALPRDLDTATYTELVREFVNENFIRHGMVADVAIHDKQAADGGRNPHMHIMLTLREVDADGFGKKNRDWNRKEHINAWRDAFEQLCNRYLAEAGSTNVISLKSYRARGIDKTAGEHLGPNAWGLEQKGQETAKGNRNRRAANDNQLRDMAKAYAEQLELEPPAAPEALREEPRDLKEVSHALAESWFDAPELRQVSDGLRRPDSDEATSGARHLGAVSRRLATAEADDARLRMEEAQRGVLAAFMHKTRQIGAAFAAQVKHYAGLLAQQTLTREREASPPSVFERYSNLGDVARGQGQKREQDYER